MRHLLVALCALALLSLAGTAPAAAQDPGDPDAAPVETVEPGEEDAGVEDPAEDDVLDPDEVPPESTAGPEVCPDDEGADGDYGYCVPCPDEPAGTDADYYYCAPSAPDGRGSPGGAGGRDAGPRAQALPHAEVRPVAGGELPLTGHEVVLYALFGAGFLLAGAGLRLTVRTDDPLR